MTALPVIESSMENHTGPYGSDPVQNLLRTAQAEGLDPYCDQSGNVLIQKPAGPGYENAQTVLIQGSTAEAALFMKQLLDNHNHSLPPLELLLTKRNETCFYGAREFDMSLLHADHMINLDGRHEHKMICSSAGGLQMNFETHVTRVSQPGNYIPAEIVFSGFSGGSGGGDMDKKKGNPIKLASEFLFRWYNFSIDTRLVSIQSGEWINHIPTDCRVRLYIEGTKRRNMDEACWWYGGELSRIYAATDPGAQVRAFYPTVDAQDIMWQPMDMDDTGRILSFLNLSPDGIISQNDQLQNLVETSSNMGVCSTSADTWTMGIQIRSADDDKKKRLREKFTQMAAMNRISCYDSHNSSHWENHEISLIRDLVLSSYQELFEETLSVVDTHNGSECAIFAEALNHIDTIGIGFDHTADGKVSASSMDRMLKVIFKALENI